MIREHPSNHNAEADERDLAKRILNGLSSPPTDLDEFAAKLAELRLLLVEENQKTNLTRVTEPSGFWVKHVFDSLLLVDACPEIFVDGAEFADLGCGAGFPSLVLAAAFPRVGFTAIDSRTKKTAFVALAARELKLDNLTVVAGRGRELARRKEFQRRFNAVTARAVADAATVCREVRGMLADAADLILYKSPAAVEDEIREARARKPASELRWSLSKTFQLPMSMGERVFLRGSRV